MAETCYGLMIFGDLKNAQFGWNFAHLIFEWISKDAINGFNFF